MKAVRLYDKVHQTNNLKLSQDAKLQFTGRYAMPHDFKLNADYRFWPDEITSFVNLSMSREVPIATTRKQGFSPSVDAAELLALLMYDVQVFEIALRGIGEPINDAEREDANFLAFRGYFRCTYAAWLSAELKAVLNFNTNGRLTENAQNITVKLNSIEDDFTQPGPLGNVAANFRRIQLGGASRVFCDSAQFFESYLLNHGYKELPPVRYLATEIYNALGALKNDTLIGLDLIKLQREKLEQNDELHFLDYCLARSQGAFFVLKTALSFLTKGIRGIKTISAPSCLKMPSQKTLNKDEIDNLKEEITSSFIDISFVQTSNGLHAKATDIFNPGTFDRKNFDSDKFNDYGFRYNFGEIND